MTASVMCNGERRRTPMHNIGAVTAVMAVMADALLKDTPAVTGDHPSLDTH